MILGVVKVAVALLLGSSAAVLLAAYPLSILGILLCFSGAELALPARHCAERDDFFLALATAGGTLALNTAAGVAIGMIASLLLAGSHHDTE